jgi:hypothetical protein
MNITKMDDKDLAKLIRKSQHAMTKEEKVKYLLRIIPEHEINAILQRYELEHLSVESQEMELEKFARFAHKELNRYTGLAGGIYLEDVWERITPESNPIPAPIDEVWFENTINVIDQHDHETERFISSVISLLNKYVSNIKVSYKRFKIKGIIFTIIRCREYDYDAESESESSDDDCAESDESDDEDDSKHVDDSTKKHSPGKKKKIDANIVLDP